MGAIWLYVKVPEGTRCCMFGSADQGNDEGLSHTREKS